MGAKDIIHEIHSNGALFKEYFKMNFKTFLEYKTSSFVQAASMFFNDIVWIVFWGLFFTKFSMLNGWTYKDLLTLWCIGTVAYGFSGVFFGNRNYFGDLIVQGKMDYYLALPKNVLFHGLITRMPASSYGDLIFGLVLALINLRPDQLPIFILLGILSGILTTAFGVIIGSLSFYFPSSERLNTTLWNGTVGLTLYPPNVYDGIAKIILFGVIPIGFVAGVPTEIIRAPNIEGVLAMAFVTLAISLIAIIVFYKGLKRYESGNLLYVNS